MTFQAFWKHHFSSKNYCGCFLGNFSQTLAFIYSTIWSHWLNNSLFGAVVFLVFRHDVRMSKLLSKHFKAEDEQNRWKDDDWSQKHSNSTLRAVIVAQLVERSLPIPEVRNSNPVISKFCIEHLVTVNCIEKTKRKKKRLGMELFLKTSQLNRKCKRLHLCR